MSTGSMDMVTSHKCGGSGYAEILTEAEHITSGCQVPNIKWLVC